MEGKGLQLVTTKLTNSPSPIINTVCPGLIKTNIARSFAEKRFFYKLATHLFLWLKANPADVGAKSLVLVATTTPEQHGMFRRPYMTDKEYAKYV
jgi:hypothetical protein